MTEHRDWLNRVKQTYDHCRGEGGFLVLFPEYRPDMSRALANFLGLNFYDFREQKMLSRGWDAAEITLDAMKESLIQEAQKSGLLVHNSEALLATKSEQERRQWLAEFLLVDWPHPVVMPLCIYQADTPKNDTRVCDIGLTEFPKESFLMRLAM